MAGLMESLRQCDKAMRRCEERSKRGLQVFKDMWGKVLGGVGGFTDWVTREKCWHLGASAFTALTFSHFYHGTFLLQNGAILTRFLRMSCCISASIHLPLSFLLTPLLLCGHCVGLCSVITMTDQHCQPKRSLRLFVHLQKGLNCQVDNSQDPWCSLSLSLPL